MFATGSIFLNRICSSKTMMQIPAIDDKQRKLTSTKTPLVKTMTTSAWKNFLQAVLALRDLGLNTKIRADTAQRIQKTKRNTKCFVDQMQSIIQATGFRISRVHRQGREMPKIIDEPTLEGESLQNISKQQNDTKYQITK